MTEKDIDNKAWGTALLAGLFVWLLMDSFIWAIIVGMLVGVTLEADLKKKEGDDDE